MKENEKQTKIKERVDTESDFVNCPILGNSIKRVIDAYPDGVDNDKIGRMLLIPREEVDKLYASAIIKLRKAMGVKKD